MRKETYVSLAIIIVLYSAFVIFTFPKVGLEYPLSYTQDTVRGEFSNTVQGTGVVTKAIYLGYLNAWSSFTLDLDASSMVSYAIQTDQSPEVPDSDLGRHLTGDHTVRHSGDFYVVVYMESTWEWDGSGIPSYIPSTTFNVDYTIEIEKSDTLDLRYATLLAISIALTIIGGRKEFYQWQGDPELEAKRTLLTGRQNHCNYCGSRNISMWTSGVMFQYCSYSCSNGAQRYLVLIFAVVMGIAALTVPPLIFVSAILAFFALFGIENHKPDFLYRNIKSKSAEADTSYHSPVPYVSMQSEEPDTGQSETTGETIWVDELDLSVRICCYQTARLQEKFCRCGRSVPAPLIEHLSK